MSKPLVSIVDVRKSFGGFTAVEGVSLDIQRGEFFSLLGPSGCGKTTLLRMLAGFDSPDSGEILIDGESSAAFPPNRRPTNMVFQSYALFPHLTIAQNIAYGLRTIDATKEEKADIVARSLTMIRLADKAQRKPHELSGGQRQRVALARALARHPKVLLLDEPLSALDKQLRQDMQLELREIQRRVGITFVFVTHDQDEALAMSDRIAVMSGGKVVQVDTPASIYEAPNTREVAAFIGTMNFIPGRVVSIAEGRAVVDIGAAGRLHVRHNGHRGGPAPGSAVVVAIRPEKIALGGQFNDNCFQGELAASSYLGDRCHMIVRVPGFERPFAVAMQNTTRMTPCAQTAVTVSWSADSAILLPESGSWT